MVSAPAFCWLAWPRFWTEAGQRDRPTSDDKAAVDEFEPGLGHMLFGVTVKARAIRPGDFATASLISSTLPIWGWAAGRRLAAVALMQPHFDTLQLSW